MRDYTLSNDKVAELLIKNGADVNIRMNDGRTPLNCAVTSGSIDVIKVFLKHGADINTKTNDGVSILSSSGGGDVMRLLIKNGADVNGKNGYGATMLHSAAGSGNKKSAKFLIRNGVVDL